MRRDMEEQNLEEEDAQDRRRLQLGVGMWWCGVVRCGAVKCEAYLNRFF